MRARIPVLASILVAAWFVIGQDVQAAPAFSEHSPMRQVADRLSMQAAAPVHQSSASMRVPNSAFSPATVDTKYDYTETSAFADTNYFGSMHSATYESLGGTDVGYYQRAEWTPSGSADAVYIRYQGLQFMAASGALKVAQDGINVIQKRTAQTASDCSTSIIHCNSVVYSYTDGTLERYDVLQVNRCLFEVAARTTSAVLTRNSDQIVQILNNVERAAVELPSCGASGAGGPQPTPTPTQAAPSPTPTTATVFSITAIRILKKDNPHAGRLKKLRTSHKLWVFAILNIRSLPATSSEADDFSIWKEHRRQWHATLRSTRSGAKAQPGSNHWTANWIEIFKPGSYRIQVRVAINGVTRSRSIKIHVWR